MQLFDVVTLPLQRNALIEASAGTGKTFTIVNLVLRYLLEPQLEPQLESRQSGQPLTIDRILVVTFTRAAVDELRGRIRLRLEQACRELEVPGATTDSTLLILLQPYLDNEEKRCQALQHLRLALLSIDEACITTIHGFCQRVLSDFAFEGGEYFEHRIIADQNDILLDAAQQFWRETFYAAPSYLAGAAVELLKSPAQLLSLVFAGLRPDVVVDPALDRDSFEQRCDVIRREFDALAASWQTHRTVLVRLLLENTALSKTSYSPKKMPLWFDALDVYFSTAQTLSELPSCFEYFTPARLEGATKKGCVTPQHEFFDACASWENAMGGLRTCLLAYAAARISEIVDEVKKEQRFVYFDDLLTMLDAMLRRDTTGALAEVLRARFPVAMIDEFQDTDATQYRIFSTLYLAKKLNVTSAQHHANKAAMLLIGDPKQAIYAFRGADINTYVAARAQVDDSACYTLGRNFRSSESVVNAVNAIFTQQQDAFAFRGAIEFARVTFEPRNTPVCEGPLLQKAGFGLCWIDGMGDSVRKKRSAMLLSAAFNAAQIHALLNDSHNTRAVHRINGERVQGRDIAVLVRDRIEAQAIRDALRDVGVDSVFLSKERVFATREAMTMYRLLCACAKPRKSALVRAVLGSELIALSASALLSLDDAQWNRHSEHFHHYQRLWSDNGFYTMWQQLLRDYPVAANILQTPNGERCLTNFQQLADLVASFEHSRLLDVTLRWFAREMQAAGGEVEEQVLRLESEANLVQVVTVHRSKGLEYPIVFLPFLFRSNSRKETAPRCFDPAIDSVVVDYGSGNQAERKVLALQQQRAEDIRLLYVALTRAKYHCVATTGKVEQLENTALHQVLFGESVTAVDDIDRWRSVLQGIASDDIIVVNDAFLDEVSSPSVQPGKFALPLLKARVLATPLPLQHRMHSYSSIVRAVVSDDTAHDYDSLSTFDMPAALPELVASTGPAVLPVTNGVDIFSFPRGANAGTFWHELLECWRQYTNAAVRTNWLTQTLQRYGFDDSRWLAGVMWHLDAVLKTPLLPGSSASLGSLAPAQVLAEMEFFLPLAVRDAKLIWQLVQSDRRGRGVDVPLPQQAQSIEGMLKGFIDAIVCIEGKYYVIDYKTNHLGFAAEDYSVAAMEREIVHHDYDLQYLIYCVALQRLLQRRLAGYEHARHFGGVLYLFIRGMGHGMGHGSDHGIYRHQPELSLLQQFDALFTASEVAA